jgi:hypothetical protein
VSKKLKIVMAACAVVITVIVLAACGLGGDKLNEPFKDAGRKGSDGSPAMVIYMPDGFSNLATKCINGVRYTVAYHGDHAYGAVTTLGGPGNGC